MSPWRSIVLLFLAFSVSGSAIGQGEEQEEKLDPYEWGTETRQLLANDLVNGFISEERGRLRAPKLPSPDATDDEWKEFI